MKSKILWLIVIILSLVALLVAKKVLSPQQAQAFATAPTSTLENVPAPVINAQATSSILVHPSVFPTPPLSLEALIDQKALKYGVASSTMRKVVNCESGGNRYAVGDLGTSYGLVQIHLIAHPDITKDQAFDPDFALDFLARNLSIGNGRIWSCWRKLQ